MGLAAVGIIGAVMSAVGTGVGAMGQMGAASAAAQTAKLQAAQANLQSQAGQTQAAVEEENRQYKLQQILSTQRAIFGSGGASLSSGSFNAIQTGDISAEARQRNNNTLLANVNSALYDTQADKFLQAGRQQSTAYSINAGTSLIDFGLKALPRLAQ